MAWLKLYTSNARLLSESFPPGTLPGSDRLHQDKAGAERLAIARIKLYTSNARLLSESFPPGTLPGSDRLHQEKAGAERLEGAWIKLCTSKSLAPVGELPSRYFTGIR